MTARVTFLIGPSSILLPATSIDVSAANIAGIVVRLV
jgi:hypothetical protein